MEIILSVILAMGQAWTSLAQADSQDLLRDKAQCTKKFCSEPNLNSELKKYCSHAPTRFQESVSDWGPEMGTENAKACWCSCKSDVN